MQKCVIVQFRYALIVLGVYDEAVQEGACVVSGFLTGFVDENCSIGCGDAGF